MAAFAMPTVTALTMPTTASFTATTVIVTKMDTGMLEVALSLGQW